MSMMDPELLQQLTPMVRQFYEIKATAPDAILFFRMGDFYEIFGDDAEQVAPLLDLVLTSRERGDKTKLPFCGVPHHSARAYWLKLLKMGYRVAIADQLEDPAEAKGLVKRGIVQIMTPGCIEDLEGLEADQANYLTGLYEVPEDRSWILAALDTSTGEFRLGRIDRADLVPWVERLAPKEFVLRRFMQDEIQERLKSFCSTQKLSFGHLPEAVLRDAHEQKQLLKDHFAVTSLAELPCGHVPGGEELVAALLLYLQSLKSSTKQFLTIQPLAMHDRMLLDETVRRDLELFETVRRREAEGSLFKEINATKTPMGARLLRYDLGHPFLTREAICERQDAVTLLLDEARDILNDIQTLLKSCADIDRLTTRVLSGRAHPADLLMIRRSLHASFQLEHMIGKISLMKSPLLAALVGNLGAGKKIAHFLDRALQDDPAALGSLQIFRESYDATFDHMRELSQHGQEQIDAYEQKLRQETGINSLKIKEHKTYGLLIEITKSNLSKVPAGFLRRQTMVNNERFVTMELEELGESLASATEQAVNRELELFQQLLQEVGAQQQILRDVAGSLALLDVLQSFAHKAHKDRYVRPELAKNGELYLKSCRHPVVERWVGQHAFMPNDVELSKKRKQLLITGPNMAGKSTVMRQTALAALLHQIGSFVPASQASMPLFDRIFTRVGAADDLSRGQSTFMVEMAEAASILRQATDKSLVILDEVGRGTSTQDGLAIAASILDYISKQVRCYALFATHYHELVPFSRSLHSVKVAQVEVLDEKTSIRFTHRLVDGASGSSFGVEVAKLAGIPEPVIQAANHFLREPESLMLGGEKKSAKALPLAPAPLEAAFAEQEALVSKRVDHAIQTVLERLERVNILRTTPMQALAILDEIKGHLEQRATETLFSEETRLC